MRIQHVFVLIMVTLLLSGQPVSLGAEPMSVIVLNPINNPEGDGTYSISWQEVIPTPSATPTSTPTSTPTPSATPTSTSTPTTSPAPIAWHYLPLIVKDAYMAHTRPPSAAGVQRQAATTVQDVYILEEDDNSAFSSPQTVYTGTLTTVELTGKPEGVYYYRVKRSDGAWSNYEPAVVHVQSLACQMFVEDFTSTTYRDATNTTADWNTSEGNLKLGRTLRVTLSGKLPSNRAGTSAAYVPGTGKVYIFGGDFFYNNDFVMVNEIVEFDPVIGSVRVLPGKLPTARYSTSAAYVPGTGKVYIFGGWTGTSYSNEIVEFDPVAGSARVLPGKLPSGRRATSAAYATGTGKVYVFGGRTGLTSASNEIVEFDPVAGSARVLPGKLPSGRDEISAAYAPETSKVYVFGGWTVSSGLDEIVEFDPVAGSVRVLPGKLPSVREMTSAAYASETSKVYVFGGWTGSSHLDEIVEFDPVAGSARVLPSKLPSGRRETSAAYAPGMGKVYVFGGVGSSGYLDEIVEGSVAAYALEQQAQSLEVDRWPIGIISATLSADQTLNGQTVTYALSNDGGATWENAALGVEHVFSDTTRSDLRWRAQLRSDGTTTPVIDRLTLIYCPSRSDSTPAVPSLNSISNANADGYYPVVWNKLPDAIEYVLEEGQSAAFSSPIIAYVGSYTSTWMTRQALGSYYYRVRAWNSAGNGVWSEQQQATVTERIAAPALNPIENADGRSSYNISWEAIGPGVSYTLQRDASPAFPTPVTVYTGTNTTSRQSVSDLGTYYYRVKAADNGLESDWSSPQSVAVTQLGPEPGHYTGWRFSVSFDVTQDQKVCNFSITVPFGTGACRITPSGCTEIAGNSFGFVRIELGANYIIVGTFDTPTHASGSFYVSMCQNVIVFPGSSGTWEASK